MPPIILLHKSPESSHEYEHQLHVWAAAFTVFAIDTPGYGLSDPLPDDELARGLAPFADNLAAVMDALGLQKAGLYGAHTGGMVALEFACRHPARADAVVINGIVALTDDEKAGILANYFDDFTPQRDGRHLTRVWHRIRDQLIFFSWYDKTSAARGRMRDTFDVPDAATLHPNLLDLLRTGVHERDGYSAAFSSNGAIMVPHIQAPPVIMEDTGSILIGQLDRLPRPLPAHVTVEIHPHPGGAGTAGTGHF